MCHDIGHAGWGKLSLFGLVWLYNQHLTLDTHSLIMLRLLLGCYLGTVRTWHGSRDCRAVTRHGGWRRPIGLGCCDQLGDAVPGRAKKPYRN